MGKWPGSPDPGVWFCRVLVASFEGAARKRGRLDTALSPAAKTPATLRAPSAPGLSVVAMAKSEGRAHLDTVHPVDAVTGSSRFLFLFYPRAGIRMAEIAEGRPMQRLSLKQFFPARQPVHNLLLTPILMARRRNSRPVSVAMVFHA